MRLFALSLLILSAPATNALAQARCASFYFSKANPSIVRFGGSNPRTPIQDMANQMLDLVPIDSADPVQIAIPTFLKVNPEQGHQFGDGQENAYADYGPFQTAPFTAVLKRHSSDNAELSIVFSPALPGIESIQEIEASAMGSSQILRRDSRGIVRLPVNLRNLAWNEVLGAKPLFFRPRGWVDWFAVQFPNPYVPISEFVNNLAQTSLQLPTGQSIIDPLGVKGSLDFQNRLKQIDDTNDLGFKLGSTNDRVHGIFINPNGSQILTATGGVMVRYRIGQPFKNVYLSQNSRAVETEQAEGVVSGTGPHLIGDGGEVILNSLMNESAMTLQGTALPSNGPNGENLAWGFTHQWVGTWLKPNFAFITTKGNFHWHLNHLSKPNIVQVFTPPSDPSSSNYFGFPKK